MAFTPEHDELRRSLQKFIAAEINPHVDQWEEDEIFPGLKASMSRSDLVAMGERVLAVKEAAPAFPEPEYAAHVHTIRMPRATSKPPLS